MGGSWNKTLKGWVFSPSKKQDLENLLIGKDYSGMDNLDILNELKLMEKEDMVKLIESNKLPSELQNVFDNSDEKLWRYIAEIYTQTQKPFDDIITYLNINLDEYKMMRKLFGDMEDDNLLEKFQLIN